MFEPFREAYRAKLGTEYAEQFLAELAHAKTTAADLHARLKESEPNPSTGWNAAEIAFQNLAKTCAACHKTFRN